MPIEYKIENDFLYKKGYNEGFVKGFSEGFALGYREGIQIADKIKELHNNALSTEEIAKKLV